MWDTRYDSRCCNASDCLTCHVHVLKCPGPRLHHHRAVQGEATHREGGSPSTQGVPSQVSQHDSTAAIQFVYEPDYPDLM